MLVEALILQICSGLSGQQLEACHKAFEAAGQQTHVTQNVKMAEDGTAKEVTARVTSVTGEKPLAVVLFTAKVARDKRLEYRLIKNSGYIPEITPTVSQSEGVLKFRWNF